MAEFGHRLPHFYVHILRIIMREGCIYEKDNLRKVVFWENR